MELKRKLKIKHPISGTDRTRDVIYLHDNELSCLSCGEKTTYTEHLDGDYYVGPSSYCISCHSRFTYQINGKALPISEALEKANTRPTEGEKDE
jgi:hypothetical protein